ncbi:MAG: DUF4037 domain-containing protein [Candidatus Latescibacteria bacterium]|jgi:hypothetical protein|nr:DUF4037 domain-containing protein [Candidatus Latescibacterota bacterium]
MNESIIDISRTFFEEVVHPLLEKHFPKETARTAFGVFGLGSEALRMDDELSRDHHWGLRIDALMPDEVYQGKSQAIMAALAETLPTSFRGHSLREGHLTGAGLAPDSLTKLLKRTIGLERAPQTHREWLGIPEEDITHLINGEVWHDPSSVFTDIRATFERATFEAYYPEPVRLRRIAHWCRYYSGMGAYALKRAILRENDFYAATRFATAIRLGVQLAFLLDRQYFPYDKWIMAYFERLPRLADPLVPIVKEAVKPETSWEAKLDCLDRISDILDGFMVQDGIIKAHGRFIGSRSSGYRLLEHAYAEIIQRLPDSLKTVVPVWDQIHLETFHSGYVDTIELDHWDQLLNLRTDSNNNK